MANNLQLPDPSKPAPAFVDAMNSPQGATIGQPDGSTYNIKNPNPPVMPTPAPAPNPGPAATPAPATGAAATPAGIGLIPATDPNQAGIDAAQKAAGIASGYLNSDGTPATAPDAATVRSQVLSQYQDQIDAINKASAQARANISTKYAGIDNERVGEERALLANTGMLGQVSGASETSKLNSSNADELNTAIAQSDAQFQAQKQALLGVVQKSADDSYQAKLTAYSQGADAVVANLKAKTQTAKDNATTAAKTAVLQGIDLSDPKNSDTVKQIATTLGTTPDVVISAYNDAKTAVDTAKAAAAKSAQTEVAPGGKIFRTNPDGSTTEVASSPEPDKFTDAKDAMGNPLSFDTTTGKYSDASGNVVTPATTSDNTGLLDQPSVDKFLQDKTPDQQTSFNGLTDLQKSDVMQLVNGDVLLSDLMSSRGVQGSAAKQQLLLEARSVDPTFSENTNKQKYTFKTEWNNPTGSAYATRTAINTAMGHLATLNDLANQLGSTPFKVVNGVAQFLSKNIDSNQTAVLGQYNDTLNLLAQEISKAYKGGVPDQPEIDAQLKSLNANTPQDVKNSIIDNKVTLMNSLLTAQANQYKNTMGEYPDQQLLDKNVLDELQAKGVDTQGLTKTLIQQGMPASSLHDYVSAFPDQADLATKIVNQNPGISEQDVLKILQGPSPYFNSVGGDTNTAAKPTAMRTDRNNNPTAMTTAAAKAMGLVAGVDYAQGDSFTDSSGKTLYTAKLIGNPVQKTIKALDKGTFFTSTGQPRWTHTAIPQSQWLAMTDQQKEAVVKSMYQKEGGSGSLSKYFT